MDMERRDVPKPRHLFLTGEKHVGKSTLLRRLLQGKEGRVGGFCTLRVRTPDGGRIHMLRAGTPDGGRAPVLWTGNSAGGKNPVLWAAEEACLPENLVFTRSHGVLSIVPGRFEQIGCEILRESAGCDLLVMDELGLAESGETAFQQAVLSCLDGPVPIYGVLQQGESEFLDRIRQHREVLPVAVTEENRERVFEQLKAEGW